MSHSRDELHIPRPGMLPASARLAYPAKPSSDDKWWREAWALLDAYLKETS